MEPQTFLDDLRSRDSYQGQIVVSRKLPAREPSFASLARPLHSRVEKALADTGTGSFFAHQAEAIDRLRNGGHTIVATGTASGKSLCYLVPIFDAVLADPRATALYLSPTKALAQDQLRAVNAFGLHEVGADVYDGDTPTPARAAIRRHANLVLTNPDMLHVGILPHHQLWTRFLRGLRFVVVDEAHALRGVFGSHVALVLRRLGRVARSYGSSPVFALASATIGNPAQHASSLVGAEVEAVTTDTAPHGERSVAFWNPPFLDSAQDGRRRSSNVEAAVLVSELVEAEARTLAFSKSRVSAELVARHAQRRLGAIGPRRVAAYRAGYLASERREIETGLQRGTLDAVSATNALELGIDVGELDAVVLNGFPGTVASAWQQAGRAGRAGQPSLAIVVPQDEPLDQFYAQHPNEFFAKPHEAALVNPSNAHVLRPHLGCAAYERPLQESDEAIFGEAMHPVLREMEEAAILRRRRGVLFWAQPRPPAPDVDIRTAGGAPYRIVEAGTGRLIGTADDARAFKVLHPGAIYLHQGETYRVSELVIDERVALVELAGAEEYTQPKTAMDLVVISEDRRSSLGKVPLSCGLVEVSEQVVAYQRRKLPGGDVVEVRDVDLPAQSLVTTAVWYTIPSELLLKALGTLTDEVLLGSLHAAEHAGIGILPVFAMCDRWDIGGLSTNFHPDTGEPTIFIHDGHPMGAGIAEHAFDVAREHLAATAAHVARCPCESGCPSCVQSPKCGNWNEPLDKQGAVGVLRAILDS